MKQNIYFLLIFILSMTSISPIQAKLKTFDITSQTKLPESKVYSRISIIDDRPEYLKKRILIDENAINQQVNNLLINNNDANKTLVIQIIRLDLVKNKKENAYVIQARSFEKNSTKDKSYFWINTLNTSLNNVDKDDVINDNISKELITFIGEQLNLVPLSYDPKYEISDFDNISFLEKENIPAYTRDVLTDGIYFNYKSFANQEPTYPEFTFKFDKTNMLKDIYLFDKAKGKKQKVNKKDIYAVVLENEIFIINNNQYTPLEIDEDNDFFFKTYLMQGSNQGIGLGFGGGRNMTLGSGIGISLASHSTNFEYTYIIDPLSGNFILKKTEIEKVDKSIFKKNAKVMHSTIEE